MSNTIYGKTIKELRQSLHLTQEHLIEKAGLVRSQLYYLESGKRIPRIDTLKTICTAMDIPMSKFFTIAEQLENKHQS